jgi:adenine-specific DNA-methyltransferase
MVVLDSIAGSPARMASALASDEKAAWSQYFTPTPVARYMAERLPLPSGDQVIRILDPGAGAGVLGIAAAERMLAANDVASVQLVAVEAESSTSKQLERNLAAAAVGFGARFAYEVVHADFLEYAEGGLLSSPPKPFDYAIANPPYAKMSPRDIRGGDAPNAYARFLESSLRILRPGGTAVFIIPRSFASGYYFKDFRRRLHRFAHLAAVHVFQSRRDVFVDDEVLQESVVVSYSKSVAWPNTVEISTSWGTEDLSQAEPLQVPVDLVRQPRDSSEVLSFPVDTRETELLSRVRGWRARLHTLGLGISTGPVVPFRAEDVMEHASDSRNAPLLWMNHVFPQKVRFPVAGFRKPQYIRQDAPPKLLVPRANYLLIRRFSAKEDRRRLTAACLWEHQIPTEVVGLENHLNYIYGQGASAAPDLLAGLCLLLSSSFLDAYFRISSGNTQVSATELRSMPLPESGVLCQLGGRALADAECDPDTVIREVMQWDIAM